MVSREEDIKDVMYALKRTSVNTYVQIYMIQIDIQHEDPKQQHSNSCAALLWGRSKCVFSVGVRGCVFFFFFCTTVV